MINELYQQQFQENYRGITDEAKELANNLKQNYKGHNYISWATMWRLMLQQDPEAKVEKLKDSNGNLVHTTHYRTYQNQKGDIIEAEMWSHFVEVQVTFMGKTVTDTYPVQDMDYSACRILNQNLVNKAFQRAMARAISMVTGLALKLYEDGDLQFEEDGKNDTNSNATTTKSTTVSTSSPTNNAKTTTKEKNKKTKKEEILEVENNRPDTQVESVKVNVESTIKSPIDITKDIIGGTYDEVVETLTKDDFDGMDDRGKLTEIAKHILKNINHKGIDQLFNAYNTMLGRNNWETVNKNDTVGEFVVKLMQISNPDRFIAQTVKSFEKMGVKLYE